MLRQWLAMVMMCAVATLSAADKKGELKEDATVFADPTEEMAAFSTAYSEALQQVTGLHNPRVLFLDKDGDGVVAPVIKIEDHITLRQSRLLLVRAVNALQQLVVDKPEFAALFPNGVDTGALELTIDVYDDQLPKELQSPISSVMLYGGRIYFMGVSQKTGGEMLLHREDYSLGLQVLHEQHLNP